MKFVLIGASVAEATTGIALLTFPSLVAKLLLGQPLIGIAVSVAGVAGIALIGLAIACWPGPPRAGMATYSGLISIYLASLGLTGVASGALLWPAVLLHFVMTALLVLSLGKESRAT